MCLQSCHFRQSPLKGSLHAQIVDKDAYPIVGLGTTEQYENGNDIFLFTGG